jgi:hypothetical protein
MCGGISVMSTVVMVSKLVKADVVRDVKSAYKADLTSSHSHPPTSTTIT